MKQDSLMKVKHQPVLDSLVAWRDTVIISNYNPLQFTLSKKFSKEDLQYGWPYLMQDEENIQKFLFLAAISQHKINDTITFESFFHDYLLRMAAQRKKEMDARIQQSIKDNSGPRVQCRGIVTIPHWERRSQYRPNTKSCPNYTNHVTGYCSSHRRR